MSNAEVSIRRGDVEDVPAVIDIARETLLEHVLASGGDPSFFSEEFLRSTLEDSSMLVAVVEDEVVGYLQFQVRAPNLMVNGAAIRPEHQRRGIGTRMFRMCTDIGAGEGCERVEISVQPTNESVHQLYLRMGFVEGENPSGWNQELAMSMDEVRALFET